jgi:hypothetical protein
MTDTDDLALWYALNRLMINYWADVDHNGAAKRTSFICRRPFTRSATIGSKEWRKSALLMNDVGGTVIPPRVTWSIIFRYSETTRGAPRRSE